MGVDWFRSWHGAPTDLKWLGVAKKANVAPAIVVALVWALMDRASQADDRGSIEGYDADGLAAFLGCEPDQVHAVVETLGALGVIKDGRFTAWEKRQPDRERESAEKSTERVRRFRERKKRQKSANLKHHETPCNANETPRNTMKRQETPPDKDRDILSNPDSSLRSESALDSKVGFETDDRPPAVPATKGLAGKGEALDVAEAVAIYNAEAKRHGWAACAKLTKARESKLKARLRDCGGLDGWAHAIERAGQSPFLTGQERGNGHANWRVTIDFIVTESKFTKLMEGAYDRSEHPKSPIDPRREAMLSGALSAIEGAD